jgi:hypothetical protein
MHAGGSALMAAEARFDNGGIAPRETQRRENHVSRIKHPWHTRWLLN